MWLKMRGQGPKKTAGAFAFLTSATGPFNKSLTFVGFCLESGALGVDKACIRRRTLWTSSCLNIQDVLNKKNNHWHFLRLGWAEGHRKVNSEQNEKLQSSGVRKQCIRQNPPFVHSFNTKVGASMYV